MGACNLFESFTNLAEYWLLTSAALTNTAWPWTNARPRVSVQNSTTQNYACRKAMYCRRCDVGGGWRHVTSRGVPFLRWVEGCVWEQVETVWFATIISDRLVRPFQRLRRHQGRRTRRLHRRMDCCFVIVVRLSLERGAMRRPWRSRRRRAFCREETQVFEALGKRSPLVSTTKEMTCAHKMTKTTHNNKHNINKHITSVLYTYTHFNWVLWKKIH